MFYRLLFAIFLVSCSVANAAPKQVLPEESRLFSGPRKLRIALSLEGILFHRISDRLSGSCVSLGLECIELPSKITYQVLPNAREFVERLRVHTELEIVWISEIDYTDILYLFNEVLPSLNPNITLHPKTQISVSTVAKRLQLLTLGFYFVNADDFICSVQEFEACLTTDVSRPIGNSTWIGPDDLYVGDQIFAYLENMSAPSHMGAITPSHRNQSILGDEWILKGQARKDREQRLNVLMGWFTQGYRALSKKFPKPTELNWIFANDAGVAELDLKIKPVLDLKTYSQVCAEHTSKGQLVRVLPMSYCKRRVVPAWILDLERRTARCLEFDPFVGAVFSATKENHLGASDCQEAPILAYQVKNNRWVDVAGYFKDEALAQELPRLRKNLAQKTVDWSWFSTRTARIFYSRMARLGRLESFSFHWWFAFGKQKYPEEFEFVRAYFRAHVGDPCEAVLENVLANPQLVETPEFRTLFMTMDQLMPELASRVPDRVFYHYSSQRGIFQTLGLTEHQDRFQFHERAQQEETYAQITRYMRTHPSSSGAWFMAEDPDTSRRYGNWQIRLTLKRSARFSKWDPAIILNGVTQVIQRMGLNAVCDPARIAAYNRNAFVHLLLEDEQVDFIEDHPGTRQWFQFLRPQAALEMIDGDLPN